MDVQLTFRVVSIDWDDEVYFEVIASNGSRAGSVLLYGELEEFVHFGNELANFPSAVSHRVAYEVGNGESSEQLLLAAYCYNPAGHTALQVVMRNGTENPWHQKVSFSIIVEAATLNRIGKKLAAWDVKKNKELACFDS